MKKRRLTQAQKKKLISLVVMVVVIAAAGILTYNGRSIQPLIEYFPFLEEIFPQQSVPAGAPASPGEEGVALRVHILDVGQADCILIQGPEKTMGSPPTPPISSSTSGTKGWNGSTTT